MAKEFFLLIGTVLLEIFFKKWSHPVGRASYPSIQVV
jgi:hypothetical protein